MHQGFLVVKRQANGFVFGAQSINQLVVVHPSVQHKTSRDRLIAFTAGSLLKKIEAFNHTSKGVVGRNFGIRRRYEYFLLGRIKSGVGGKKYLVKMKNKCTAKKEQQ